MELIDRVWLKNQFTGSAKMAITLALDGAPVIDPVHAAGGCYCYKCEYSRLVKSCSKYECTKMSGPLRNSNDFCSRGKMKSEQN